MRVVGPGKGVIVTVGKNQIARDSVVIGKGNHTSDDRIGRWEFSETTAFNHQGRKEIQKRICTLNIASRTEADCWKCARLHTIGGRRIFMNLTVGTEQSTAMVFVREFVAEDDLTRAELRRNTISNGEVIEPHDHIVDEVDEHDPRDAGIRKSVENPTTAFFDDPNSSLDVTNVFGRSGSVEGRLGYMILDLFKFIIHEENAHSEASTGVDGDNPREKEPEFEGSTLGCMFNCC